MSGALAALGTLGSQAFAPVSSALSSAFPGLSPVLAFIRQPRSIGTIIPDVTIEEHFEDRLQVTLHPLATGTPVSDHAFRLPRTVTMKVGFTNSNPVGAAVGGFTSALSSGASVGSALGSAGSGLLGSLTEQRAKQIYDQLLALQYNDSSQQPVVPFQLTAGKRTYKNMVITELNATNTAATEYALIIEVHMQEVIVIDTAGAPTQSSQAQTTAPPTNTGTQSTTPATAIPTPSLDATLGPGTVTKPGP